MTYSGRLYDAQSRPGGSARAGSEIRGLQNLPQALVGAGSVVSCHPRGFSLSPLHLHLRLYGELRHERGAR